MRRNAKKTIAVGVNSRTPRAATTRVKTTKVRVRKATKVRTSTVSRLHQHLRTAARRRVRMAVALAADEAKTTKARIPRGKARTRARTTKEALERAKAMAIGTIKAEARGETKEWGDGSWNRSPSQSNW